MNSFKKPGKLLYANWDIHLDELPIEQLDHYIAIENFLTDDEVSPPNVDNLEKVRGYLEAFYHLANMADWERAKEVLFIRLDVPTNEELHSQLSIWGYHHKLIDLYSNLLDKLLPKLNAICWNGRGRSYFFLGDYTSAINAYECSLKIANDLQNNQLQSTILRNIGGAYHLLGNYQEAIDLYQQSLTIARKIQDRLLESTALGNLGVTYHSLGEYQKSIDYQHQRLKIVRKIQDRQGEKDLLGNLGNDYLRIGNYKKSIECYEQVLNITRETQNRNGEGMALNNLGYAYHCLEDYSQAVKYYKQSLVIKREIGDRPGEGNALCNLGTTLMQIKQYSEAKEALQTSENICRQIGYRSTESESLLRRAELHYKLDDRALALKCCDRALSIAIELGIPLAKECQELKEKF